MNNGTKRILVVDDDYSYQLLISMYLKKNGYEVLQAGNGYEAIETLNREHVDLIVLDLMMPKMDGFRFLRWLRTEAQNNTPVLVLTAVDGTEIRQDIMQAGATAVRLKPVKGPEIIAAISDL